MASVNNMLIAAVFCVLVSAVNTHWPGYFVPQSTNIIRCHSHFSCPLRQTCLYNPIYRCHTCSPQGPVRCSTDHDCPTHQNCIFSLHYQCGTCQERRPQICCRNSDCPGREICSCRVAFWYKSCFCEPGVESTTTTLKTTSRVTSMTTTEAPTSSAPTTTHVAETTTARDVDNEPDEDEDYSGDFGFQSQNLKLAVLTSSGAKFVNLFVHFGVALFCYCFKLVGQEVM